MAGGRRVAHVEHAERVNAAAGLLAAGMPVAEVARALAERFAVSNRQGRRYAERAAASGPVAVPEASVVFTVRLPAALAERVRAQARGAGITISALVAQALSEFLARGGRKRSGR